MPTATAANPAIPQNLDAERATLGTVLLENGHLPYIRERIALQDFYSYNHRITYQAMCAMADAGQIIDLVSLSEKIAIEGNLEKAGGPAYLAALTDGVPIGTDVGLKEYVRIIKEKSRQRRLLELTDRVNHLIMGGVENADSLLAETMAEIQGLRLIEAPISDETGETAAALKIEPETGKKPRAKKSENFYPTMPADAWHSAAELYRRAHADCTEGSDNWHFFTFYASVGAMLGRSVGTRMGGMIYGNLYAVLVGQVGGDGKDTVADFGTDFIQLVDSSVYIPEAIDSKPGFCKEWAEHNQRAQIATNHRALLRLPEIRTYLDAAQQSGTKSVAPMLLTHYSPRPTLDNSSIATPVHIIKPHLSMLACGAKRFIGQIPESDLINGLGRRICFVPGDPKGPNDDPPGPDLEILGNLANAMKDVLDFYRFRPNCQLEFSPASKKIWRDWYKHYWKRKRGDDLLAALNNGDRVTCRKIALINAALDRAEKYIEPMHLEPAIAATQFLYECRYPIFSEHGANPFVEIEKKILDKIPEPPGRVLKRWLQRYLRSIDSKTFNDRIKYMVMDDGPLILHREGKKVWLSRAE